MALSIRNISVSRGTQALVHDVSATVEQGKLLSVIGPNGAGKTTLLRACLGLDEHSGSMLVDGAPWQGLSPTERARRIAYLPQKRPLAWPIRVRDVVALGRFAYGAAPPALSRDDAQAVDEALAACGLDRLADRAADTLSGGEEARLHCARAMAAGTPYILADEPAASLDPYHQHHVMKLFRQAADSGRGVAVVLHDLSLALHYADDVLVLKEGRAVAGGPAKDVLTPALISDVYGVTARVSEDGVTVLP